jgi:ABC-type nitrate/sulfonate/bicarbonate transport system substrate-binding protein
MLTKAKVATAAVALFAVIGVIAVARAEPMTMRIGWVVTPGHMPPVIEALGKREPTMLKHLVLRPLRFNGD